MHLFNHLLILAQSQPLRICKTLALFSIHANFCPISVDGLKEQQHKKS